MNTRLALAGAAIGTLTAGSLFAQDTNSVEQQYHKPNANPNYAARHPRREDQANRCDRTYSRAQYACNNARFARERNRRAYRDDRYAYGYSGYADPGYYPGPAYYPGYDDSDFYGPYGQPPRSGYYDRDYYGQGYYAPPPNAEDYGAPAAYEAPPEAEVAPVYVPGRRYYWEYPGDTSPAAQYSVRLHGYVNPHSSVTAIPTPNNVSDQVPSHGLDYDGVPPDYPY